MLGPSPNDRTLCQHNDDDDDDNDILCLCVFVCLFELCTNVCIYIYTIYMCFQRIYYFGCMDATYVLTLYMFMMSVFMSLNRSETYETSSLI